MINWPKQLPKTLAQSAILLGLALSALPGYAQEHAGVADAQVETLQQAAAQELKKGNYDKALAQVEEAIKMASANGNKGKSGALLLAGRIYRTQKRLSDALIHLTQAALAAETQGEDEIGYAANFEIAQIYAQQSAHDKAQKYLLAALKFAQIQKSEGKVLHVTEQLAEAALSLKDHANAEKYYKQVLAAWQKRDEYDNVLIMLGKLTNTCKAAEHYTDAANYCQQAIDLASAKNDLETAADLMNDQGYIFALAGERDQAIDRFKNAVAVYQQLSNSGQLSDSKRATVYVNQGAAYAHLNDLKNAFWNYNQALKLRRQSQDLVGEAKVLNHLGTAHYMQKNYREAAKVVNQAIALATQKGATETLMESYRILAEVLQKDNRLRDSQQYLRLYQSIKDSVTQAQSKEQQQQMRDMMNAEKQEGELRMLLADREKQEMALKQLTLEAEKKQQTLDLLRRDQDLQAARLRSQELEKDRLAKTAALTTQQLEAARRDQEIAELQRTQEAREFELTQKTLEEDKQKAAIALLEEQKKLQDANLEQEKAQRKFTNWGLGLLAAILGVSVIGFVSKMRANRLLKAQQAEIAEKNTLLVKNEEELRQNMEELQAAQEIMARRQTELEVANKKMEANERVLKKAYDQIREREVQISAQKQELEAAFGELKRQNIRITDSIRYAERIQKAVMPSDKQLAANFKDHFLIYLPKDMVSGDFYWFSKIGNKRFWAVVDCTGHGVPGAFMSMIGNTMLNQIVNEKHVYEPEKVLEHLDANIRHSLQHQDSESNDGMDIGLCCIETWEDGTISLKYAGAKVSAYYTVDGEIHQLKADRVPIGGMEVSTFQPYTPHTVRLAPGSSIYMATDGFMDAGNPDRQRFGSGRFAELIAQNQHQELPEQGGVLLAALAEHQAGEHQRDDITVMGVKV
ncbi:MAG: tetratricopeptide repeat protein [Bernardetiaceae bacterium]|jgi:serine phosphatase RsbU (regulator of sigma subunit)/tetratricopeptide (TPR) repeat protein|nr:tetratricopeptide repeat protein [Bernardetiaceae bacterium]